MNFKRGYSREKKLIEWKTPRYIQTEKDYLEEEKIAKWKSEKRFKCKKLKGDHDFVEFRREILYLWRGQELVEFMCSACGKKKVVINKRI